MRMEQRQLLTPRMIQSMEILQLPLMALEERIEQELQANPVLEFNEGESEADTIVDASNADERVDRIEDERALVEGRLRPGRGLRSAREAKRIPRK